MCRLCISPWNFNTKFSPTYPWYNVHIMARARYLHSELSGHEKYRITAKVTEVLMWNLAPDYTHRAQLVYSRTRHKECSRRQLRENPYKLKQCVNASTLWIINTRGSSTLWITRNVNCGKELDNIFLINNWMKKNAISKCTFIVQVIRVYFTTICWTIITSINSLAWS